MNKSGKNSKGTAKRSPLKRLFDAAIKFGGWCLTVPSRLFLFYANKIQQNKVIFLTFNHNYMCNPKYICEELRRQKLPVDLVWAVSARHMKSKDFPPDVRKVAHGTREFFKEMVSAKVWVDNAFGFSWNPLPTKKRKQFYIQTWHGSLGLKRIDKKNVKNTRWSIAAWLNSKWADLCVSNSAFETEVYRQTHWPKTPILELGHARNDIFFADEETKNAIIARVRARFKIEEGKKIALYAPTFRKHDGTGCYDLDRSRFLDALQEKFGGEWVLLNRYHMKTLNARKKKLSSIDKRIINATAYPDIQELMVAADVGITDYSSWICDFVLTGRPGFIYAPDLDYYTQERGFYYPLEETPFPLSQTNEQLLENIRTFDADLYAQKKESFLSARGCIEDGAAAKRIVEIIKQQCGLN